MEVTERKRRGPQKEWREDWLGETTKAREVDSDKVFTCEKNFHCEDMETCR